MLCWKDVEASRITHVLLEICTVGVLSYFFILFYSFKRYNAQFVLILIHTLHNVFIGRFSSPPTALGRTSIRPARHDHVWGFFVYLECILCFTNNALLESFYPIFTNILHSINGSYLKLLNVLMSPARCLCPFSCSSSHVPENELHREFL